MKDSFAEVRSYEPPADSAEPSGDPSAPATASAAPAETSAAPIETATPAPGAASWRDEIVGDDEDLPPSYKGKKRGEVYDLARRSLSDQQKAQMERNTLEREKISLEAELRAIREGRLTLPPQVKTEEPAKPKPYGLESDDEAYVRLPEVIRQVHEAQRALEAKQQEIDKSIADERQRREDDAAHAKQRETNAAVDTVRRSAREIVSDKIPAEAWEEYSPLMAGTMMLNRLDPTMPENWVAVARFHKLDTLLAATPRTVARTAAPPPAGGAVPGARAVSGEGERATTGNPTLDAGANEIAAAFTKAAKSEGRSGIKSEAVIESMSSRRRPEQQRQRAS